MTEIADRLSVSRNTVTELCSRAEEVGLVRREDAEEDRRLVYLELTEEAERRLYGALNEMDRHRGEIAQAFDELYAVISPYRNPKVKAETAAAVRQS